MSERTDREFIEAVTRWRSEDKPRSSASNSADLLSAVELTRTQETKLRYLIEKGGNYSAVTVHVGMPEGSFADVDPFWRVTWRGR